MSPTEQQLDTRFAALADPTRRAIISRLSVGDATVKELAEMFPVTLQAVSRHVKVLERCGLISQRVDAQRRPCRLEVGNMGDLAEWINSQKEQWEARLDTLETHLEEIQRKENEQ